MKVKEPSGTRALSESSDGLQGQEKTVSEERAFVENWWKRKFSRPNLPTGDDVIMFAHALEASKGIPRNRRRQVDEGPD
jgi:hypothetical protein